jgi:hypothetical protein
LAGRCASADGKEGMKTWSSEMNTTYRGFNIDLVKGDEWSAKITNASTGRSWSKQPSTPLEAGSEACMQRATKLVDAFIALHG